MEAARIERTTVEISDRPGRTGLRATGQVILFDGFLKLYEEGRDDGEAEDDARLPPIAEGATLKRAGGAYHPDFGKLLADDSRAVIDDELPGLQKAPGGVMTEDASILALQSFTQPPPRYTEATLVKRMEELGIGRPSTYASIVSTIQDRSYVRKDKNRLFPEDKGRLVTAFLENYFRRYVSYDFTAGLEEELDDISGGRLDWQEVLSKFWKEFTAAVSETQDLRISEVLEKINEVLAPHLFPDPGDGTDPRQCPLCKIGRLNLKTARSGGAFIGCSAYPDCRYTRPLGGDDGDAELSGEGRLLGHDEHGEPVRLKIGPYGPYVQLGEGEKPKRSSLPKGTSTDDVTLERALALLALPREVGLHPDDGAKIEAGVGRFGPYVKHNKTYASLEKGDEVLTIGMNRAMELIARKAARGGRGAAQKPLRVIGEHPDGGEVAVMDGRYGHYVKWEKVNATIPKDRPHEALTLEEALELIAAKAPKKKAGAKKKATPKAKAADGEEKPKKKAPAKKTAGQENHGKDGRGQEGSCEEGAREKGGQASGEVHCLAKGRRVTPGPR